MRHEVADDLLGDVQVALELDDGLGGGVEDDDVVGALAMRSDGIGETSAAPGLTLMIWPPEPMIDRVARSMVAWIRSSARSGRRMSMSS